MTTLPSLTSQAESVLAAIIAHWVQQSQSSALLVLTTTRLELSQMLIACHVQSVATALREAKCLSNAPLATTVTLVHLLRSLVQVGSTVTKKMNTNGGPVP